MYHPYTTIEKTEDSGEHKVVIESDVYNLVEKLSTSKEDILDEFSTSDIKKLFKLICLDKITELDCGLIRYPELGQRMTVQELSGYFTTLLPIFHKNINYYNMLRVRSYKWLVLLALARIGGSGLVYKYLDIVNSEKDSFRTIIDLDSLSKELLYLL